MVLDKQLDVIGNFQNDDNTAKMTGIPKMNQA